jgi:hypothetical protein
MDLCRLSSDGPGSRQAVSRVAEVYGRVSEGHDTADLRAAAALLGEAGVEVVPLSAAAGDD